MSGRSGSEVERNRRIKRASASERRIALSSRAVIFLYTFFSYLPDSSEMQMRLLGDLAFLAQNYDVAYSSYHTCKRDFQTDHAWSYYAGALVSCTQSRGTSGGSTVRYLCDC